MDYINGFLVGLPMRIRGHLSPNRSTAYIQGFVGGLRRDSSPRRGQTKRQNGKTYIFNANSRWELVKTGKKTEPQGRGKKGGEIRMEKLAKLYSQVTNPSANLDDSVYDQFEAEVERLGSTPLPGKEKAFAAISKLLNAQMMTDGAMESTVGGGVAAMVEHQLSPTELGAVKAYTNYKGVGAVQSKLRGLQSTEKPILNDSESELYAKELDNALDKLPVHRGVVWRGMHGNMPNEELESAARTGEPFVDKGFMSTAVLEKGQDKDGFSMSRFSGRKGTDKYKYLIRVESKSGRKLEGLQYGAEPEVLFKPDSKFSASFTGEDEDGVRLFTLKEI